MNQDGFGSELYILIQHQVMDSRSVVSMPIGPLLSQRANLEELVGGRWLIDQFLGVGWVDPYYLVA